jgi:hypothetical protein
VLGSGPDGRSKFEPLTALEMGFVALSVAAVLAMASVSLVVVALGRICECRSALGRHADNGAQEPHTYMTALINQERPSCVHHRSAYTS